MPKANPEVLSEAIVHQIEVIVREFFAPVVEAPIKRLETDLETVLDRVVALERMLAADPREKLREDLDRIETRARLLKKGL